MTDEKRVYVGNDANGNALYVGDRVKVINHPTISPTAVGKTRTIHSASLRYPLPDHLMAALGDVGWFEAATDDRKFYGLHGRVVVKVESA